MTPENSSYTSLGEQTRLLNMALKYTGGDAEKAKMMAAGQYEDVVVIKGKFLLDKMNIYGIFLLFLNPAFRYLMNVNTIILPDSATVDKVRIFNPWKTFYKEFVQLVQKEGERAVGSYDFTKHFADSLDNYDIYEYVNSSNLNGITDILREITKKFYNTDKALCQIEMERSSSIAVEMEGIPIELPSNAPESGEPAEEKLSEFDARIAEIEKQAGYVIEAKIIVSPLKGKNIHEVKSGDNIKVVLLNRDEVSMAVAKLLNGIDSEGKYLPIKARVKEKVPLEKSGCILYCLVAKDVFVKVVEEENVKIEMDKMATDEKPEQEDSKLVLYLALLLGLVILSLIVILAIL